MIILFGIVLAGLLAVGSGIRLWRVRPDRLITRVALRSISLLLLLVGSWLLLGALSLFIQPF